MQPPTASDTRLNEICREPDSPEAQHLAVTLRGSSYAEKKNNLMYYTQRDCGHVVKLLCTRGGCDKNAELGLNGKRWTALRYAALIGAVQSMLALLECGADKSLETIEGLRAIHLAAQQGKLECVSLLLRFGEAVDVATSNEDQFAPLIQSAMKGLTPVVRLLLEPGAVVGQVVDHGADHHH
jgi:hypothetical protein